MEDRLARRVFCKKGRIKGLFIVLFSMRLHRFIRDVDLSVHRLVISDRATTNQLLNVFRLVVGDRFVVCDGKESEAVVEILEVDSMIVVEIIERHSVKTESAIRVVLYCAVLKRENFEWVVQKATECGVTEVIPVVTERTVKLGVRLDRLQTIAREAAEQCGRGVVPVIHEPTSFKEALSHSFVNGMNIAFEIGAKTLERDFRRTGVSSVGIFIGPEGGWNDDEMEQLRVAGYHVAGLGPRVLRAETAAIVASFMITSYD